MTWQTINKVLNRNKTRKILPSFLQKNSNRNITDPIDIANKFNEYFVKIGPQLAKKIRRTTIYHMKGTIVVIMSKYVH
jgi:hypothetical protein